MGVNQSLGSKKEPKVPQNNLEPVDPVLKLQTYLEKKNSKFLFKDENGNPVKMVTKDSRVSVKSQKSLYDQLHNVSFLDQAQGNIYFKPMSSSIS